jgi:hypothetical protein
MKNPAKTFEVSIDANAAKGFALVIALGLMSFIVLLLLGITTFVRVESSAAAQSLRLLEARQNALLGGMIAVGELKKQLGPDQRATANAETVSASSPNPLWLGAFQTMDSANPTATREQVRSASLANVEWLVSRPGDASQPADFASDHSGDTDNFIRMGAFTRADNTTIEAFAGKTRISPALTSSGSFAWWVSDESQKARVNEVEEESEFLSATSQSLADFSTAQKTDLRALDSATVADPDFAPGPLQARISRFADLELLPFSPADEWGPLELALTSFSESVPVDVTQGRLRQDLSAYLAGLGATISDGQRIIRGNANDTNYVGPPLALNPDGADLPTFGLIRDWHNLSTGSRLPQTAAPHDGRQHFAPIVTRFLVSHLPGLDYGAERETEPGVYDPARLLWRFKPAFILWNPYDHVIAASDYLFQVNGNMRMVLRSQFNQNNAVGNNMQIASSQHGGAPIYAVFDSAGGRPQFIDFYDFLVEDGDDLLEVSPGNRIRWFNFVVRNLALQPGEVIVLTPASDRPYVNQPASWYFNAANRSQGNLLEADINELNGFIFDPDMEVRDPAQGDGPSPFDDQFGFYWPSQADINNGRMYPRFRVWALETATGSPQIVQDMSTIFDQGTDAFGWRLDHAARENNSPLARGWGTNTTNRPAHRITGINDHLNTTQVYQRSFSNHWMGLAVAGDTSLSRAAVMDLLNISSASAGTTLRDVGIDESLTSRYFLDRGNPGWNVNGAGFKIATNRYGRWSSISFIHPHDESFQDAGFEFIYSHLRPSVQPLTSIGQLHNVAFSPHVWQPRQPFGSSQPSPFLDRELSFGNTAGQSVAGRPTTSRTRAALDAPNALIDLPYALNSSLFDRFFVSSLPFAQLTDGNINPATILPNSRLRFVPDQNGNFPTASTLTGDNYAFERSAAHLRVKGGFNVNSTSREAWKLLLSGTFDRQVNTQNGGFSNADERFPFARNAIPYLPENLSRGTRFESEDFNAIRTLSEEELDALAGAIVEEVKLRGPFLSLADFVNRRLIADSNDEAADWLGLAGTLQAAIDKLSHNPAIVSPALAGFAGMNRAYYQDVPADSVRAVASIDEARREHVAGGIPTGYNATRYRGGPRYLMQRDLLSALAPLLNVRGDTFTVRAYGESSHGLNGNPASAKCEIVIQRIAAPAEADNLIEPSGPFGRQFQIVAFRWIEGGSH